MRSFSVQTEQRKTDVTFTDVINSRQDDIHAQMYAKALKSWISYAGIDPDSYRMIEIKASYFDTPSKVDVMLKEYPYTRKIVDLSPFWDEYDFSSSMSYMKLDNDNSVETAEVIYKDYVRGYAVMHSRLTDATFKVSLKDLPEDAKEYEDEKSFVHSFSYKVSNKIYGRDDY